MNQKEFDWALWKLNADLEMWYSYLIQGLRNEIHGHCRKDQRTYQRKFCSLLARKQKFLSNYAEYLI